MLERTLSRPVVVEPGDSAQRFEMGMLDARYEVGAFVGHIGFGKAGFDVAEIAVHVGDDIVFRIGNTGFRALVVDDRRAILHGQFRIEHRRQDFIVDQ